MGNYRLAVMATEKGYKAAIQCYHLGWLDMKSVTANNPYLAVQELIDEMTSEIETLEKYIEIAKEGEGLWEI